MTPQAERYQHVRHLASGGMGHVYTAWDRVHDRPVALKLAASTQLARQCLAKEGRWVRRIDHPNVVRAFESGTTRSGRPYFSMEFICGRSLHDIIVKGGPLNLRRACHWVGQLCAGVAAVHRAGLAHRDLKPANIMVQRTQHGTEVKLIDFGLATRLSERRVFSKTVAGTPGYIAPELVGGAPADERSDVYSLGAILRFALTGRPPRADLATVALNSDPAGPIGNHDPAVPEPARHLVALCLHENPNARPQTAAELSALLVDTSAREHATTPPSTSCEAELFPSSRTYARTECEASHDTFEDTTPFSHAC